MHTTVASVQHVGPRQTWPQDHVYVGMPGKASRAFGIPDAEGIFGKAWSLLEDPRGWAVAYSDVTAKRLVADEAWAAKVKDLHGKTLLCWCTAKEQQRGTEVQCHARILAEYVELLFHARR